jgi:hypothetical protein
MFEEERVYPLAFAEKLQRLFSYDFPGVRDVRTTPVWVAGELLEFGGKFNEYITSKRLQKQEGIVFRHLLRLIILLGEFQQLTPPEIDQETWQTDLQQIRGVVTEGCRALDPTSTDKVLQA